MEDTECFERAILPEKALREKLETVIEDEFSKVTLRNAIEYFKTHSGNDCVGATVKVMEYSLTKKEVPKPYQTLLKEIPTKLLFFSRSTKSRASMSMSSHFSPTKNFWS